MDTDSDHKRIKMNKIICPMKVKSSSYGPFMHRAEALWGRKTTSALTEQLEKGHAFIDSTLFTIYYSTTMKGEMERSRP